MQTVILEDREQMDEIIRTQKVCHAAIVTQNGLPYCFPMSFGYDGDAIYLHSGPDTGAVRSLQESDEPEICVTFCTDSEVIYYNKEVACSYRMRGASVICRGRVEFVENYDKKLEALNITMRQYTGGAFTYSEPAVNNVVIWKIKVRDISARMYGVPYTQTKKYEKNKPYIDKLLSKK